MEAAFDLSSSDRTACVGFVRWSYQPISLDPSLYMVFIVCNCRLSFYVVWHENTSSCMMYAPDDSVQNNVLPTVESTFFVKWLKTAGTACRKRRKFVTGTVRLQGGPKKRGHGLTRVKKIKIGEYFVKLQAKNVIVTCTFFAF